MKVYGAAQYFKNAHDIDGVLSGKGESAVSRFAGNTSIGAAMHADQISAVKNDKSDVTAQIAYVLRLVNVTGYGINLGASAPMPFGGDFMISAGYADADLKASLNVNTISVGKFGDLKAYTALAGYEYPFSKRTKVYVGAGWTKYEVKAKGQRSGSAKLETQTFQAMTGLVHKF
jgi:predicted porin